MADKSTQAQEQHASSVESSVTRSAALMSALVFISRITGFIRTWVQARALGPTGLASAYAVANNLPTQIYELVTAGMLATAFLPVYVAVKKRSGQKGANEYTSNLMSIVIALTAVVTLISFIFAGQIIWSQSFSASSGFDTERSVWFFRFFTIEIVLYAVSMIVSGVVNAERDYLWSNLAPIFNNFVTIASFVAYERLSESSPTLALVILALGNPLGVLVQLVLQLPSMFSHGLKLRWRIDFSDPALKDTMKIGIPSIIMMLITFVTNAVQTNAGLEITEAGASISAYVRPWFNLPYAIVAVPITTALFTELSESYAQNDMDAFRRSVTRGSAQILFLLTPFALYLMLFSREIVTIAGAGRFEDTSMNDAIQFLLGLAPSLPFYALTMFELKVCSATRQMSSFALASLVAAIPQVVLCIFVAPRLGMWSVTFTSFLFALVVDVVIYVLLEREIGNLDLTSMLYSLIRSLLVSLASCVLAWLVLLLVNRFTGSEGYSMMQAFIRCLIGGSVALVSCFGLAFVLKMPEAEVLHTLLARFTRAR